MSPPFCRLPDELTSHILVLAYLHAPFFIPSSAVSCRCPEQTHHSPQPVQYPTFQALHTLLSISRSIRAVGLATPQLFTSLELNLSVFPNPSSTWAAYRYDDDLSAAAPKINSFFSRSGDLPLTLRLRAMDWEDWYRHAVGHPYTNRGVSLRSNSGSRVLVPLSFIYNSNPFGMPEGIDSSVDSMLSLRRQYFNVLARQVQRFISDVILNPSFQGRWETLQLEVPVHFGFKDLLASLVAAGATTPAWESLRSLRLTASYEDSSLTPARGTESLLFGGRSIQAPNLKDIRLDLRTVVKSAPEAFNFYVASIQLPAPSSTITHLRLDTYTTTPQLLFLLSTTSGLEMCDVRLHADVMEEEDINAVWTMEPRGRTMLSRLTYLAIRSAYHLIILNYLCAPALKGLYVEMDDESQEVDVESWEEDHDGENVADEDHNAPDEVLIPTASDESPPSRILEAFVHAGSTGALNSNLQTDLLYLKIVSVPLSDSSLIRILRWTPQLRELRVWWGPTGRFMDELLPASILCATSGVVNSSDILPILRYVERHPNYPQQHYPRSRLQRATTLVPCLEYLSVNIHPERNEQALQVGDRLKRLAKARVEASREYTRQLESGQANSASSPEKLIRLRGGLIRFNTRDAHGQGLALERIDTDMPEFECSE